MTALPSSESNVAFLLPMWSAMKPNALIPMKAPMFMIAMKVAIMPMFRPRSCTR
ncbi:hypothetical protein D9M71_764310 [compost metagenome]